jgi:hypothetical protein
MPAAQLASNLKSAAYVVRTDLADFVKHRNRVDTDALPQRERGAVADLKRDGYAVIAGFWPRERALELRDRLGQYLQPEESRDFESGAYIRFWDNRAYDEGVRRLYHVDKEIPELKEFRHDPFVMKVVEAYYGFPMHSGVLVFQHNTKSNANTRYHHVDVYSKEFKAFLYLDDVDHGNGPFTYLRGTHKSHYRRIRRQVLWNGDGSPTSFFEDDLGPLLQREVEITGPAGTLILADVRGFHRGSPQIDRSRSVLVNYMYRHEGDMVLDR